MERARSRKCLGRGGRRRHAHKYKEERRNRVSEREGKR